MMKRLYYILVPFLCLGYGCQNKTTKDYGVGTKDSANFTVFLSMLYPKEHLLVKVNNQVIFDKVGEDIKGSPTGEYYFHYPDTIKKIEITSQFKGKIVLNKSFIDTLTEAKQRTLIISRPFPKGMTKENYKPYGYVPIDSSDRHITLVNDAVHHKDTLVL
ncbi:hypothetical protein DBR11_04040 [Pedobacter sp. HMWF019]|uniref:hypothetical protein n=1 Tax=Pedobacter sp. HMWF019 TaxID=2056856 RepID=UPI000D3C6BE9|nr:hypothetical protein [Pedobacter sp. HMWF019]PTT02778.1 hypothetical protein DBR11_04040 [Pedobacter sp. HMWF019]